MTTNRFLLHVLCVFCLICTLPIGVAGAGSYRATNQETSPDSDTTTEATDKSTQKNSKSKSDSKSESEEGPFLVIKSRKESRKFSRAALLKSPYLKKLIVEKDPAYKNRKMTYSVVPASQLFGEFNVNDSMSISFVCLDGFSAPISTEQLLNTKPTGAIAYIAIEMENDAWPKIKNHGDHSAGPFYLVWENPEKSKISFEQWPFQLSGFDIKGTLAEQFPHTAPDPSITASNSIAKGYRSFMKNCFACHSINGEGLAHIGPDLNLPFNPTEYLRPNFLETLIRNPKNLRSWPDSKMSSFDSSALPDDELKDLINYLRYMAIHKKH